MLLAITLAVIEALKAVRSASALEEERERLFELAFMTFRALSTLNEDTE